MNSFELNVEDLHLTKKNDIFLIEPRYKILLKQVKVYSITDFDSSKKRVKLNFDILDNNNHQIFNVDDAVKKLLIQQSHWKNYKITPRTIQNCFRDSLGLQNRIGISMTREEAQSYQIDNCYTIVIYPDCCWFFKDMIGIKWLLESSLKLENVELSKGNKGQIQENADWDIGLDTD